MKNITLEVGDLVGGTASLRQEKAVKRRYYRRLTVSPEFRELTEEIFPAIRENIAYRRLLHYLLFGSFFDLDSGRLVISQDVLADIEGWQGGKGNYRGQTFLLKFQTQVMSHETFRWTNWIGGKKARQVETFILPSEFEKALQKEREKPYRSQRRVDFCDGGADSPRKQKIERGKRKAAAEALFHKADCQEIREILMYLNSLPQNLFTTVVKENFERAVLVAKAIKKPRSREYQLRLLHNIRDQPQGFYAPSKWGRTVRIYELGGGITNLKGDVRCALTAGWHEADLRSSQLAICAKQWGVPEVQEFLGKGRISIWDTLGAHLNLNSDELIEAKPFFKVAIYSTCYGKQWNQIVECLGIALKMLQIQRDAALFFTHPLTKALLAARNAQMKKIRNDGGAITVFGKELLIQKGVLDAKQILAQQAQAAELHLLYPVFKMAAQTKEFTITLFQHDGFSVHFGKRPEFWREKLKAAIADQTVAMGVATTLEWKN
jgi:hypothetical protein